MNECIIGIGSNIGAETNIGKMLEILTEKVEIVQVSSFLKTKPLGISDQPDYTNGAVKIRTFFTYDELIPVLKWIEDQLGRDRTAPKFGPRTMDLDIVVWNGLIVDNDYYSRDFLKAVVDQLL
jgi:2-amino-4-hydroxy-6-hydroxymethyldihydropteridine diphosphokinase